MPIHVDNLGFTAKTLNFSFKTDKNTQKSLLVIWLLIKITNRLINRIVNRVTNQGYSLIQSDYESDYKSDDGLVCDSSDYLNLATLTGI